MCTGAVLAVTTLVLRGACALSSPLISGLHVSLVSVVNPSPPRESHPPKTSRPTSTDGTFFCILMTDGFQRRDFSVVLLVEDDGEE